VLINGYAQLSSNHYPTSQVTDELLDVSYDSACKPNNWYHFLSLKSPLWERGLNSSLRLRTQWYFSLVIPCSRVFKPYV